MGHRVKHCPNKGQSAEDAKCVDDVCLNVSAHYVDGPILKWCLDSGATSHFCNEAEHFRKMYDAKRGILNLANSETTDTAGTRKAHFSANVPSPIKDVTLVQCVISPCERIYYRSVKSRISVLKLDFKKTVPL